MERNTILSVAIDAVRGRVLGNYTKEDTSASLREAFIDLNGGSKAINPKTFHRGNALFELIQELIPVIIDEGIKEESNPLFALVDYRNIKAGDTSEFDTEGECNFIVASAAGGIQGVRRQRITDGTPVSVDTETKIARVYDTLGRLLAGRVTFDKFVDGVAKAFKNYITNDAYTAISGLSASTAGLDSTYVVSGTFDESSLLTLIGHVEAATGKTAKIIGTKTALRKITTATIADEAKSDVYNMGYYGKFNGTEMVCMNQAHKPGTSTFALSDSKIWVIAADDKPVKVVNEGDGLLIEREAERNADLTQEYVYAQAMGIGVLCAAKLGVYTITAAAT